MIYITMDREEFEALEQELFGIKNANEVVENGQDSNKTE